MCILPSPGFRLRRILWVFLACVEGEARRGREYALEPIIEGPVFASARQLGRPELMLPRSTRSGPSCSKIEPSQRRTSAQKGVAGLPLAESRPGQGGGKTAQSGASPSCDGRKLSRGLVDHAGIEPATS